MRGSSIPPDLDEEDVVVATEATDITDGLDYLIALRPTPLRPSYQFQARDASGRITWARNPSKAMLFKGCKALRQALAKNASLVAVVAPHEAHSR